MVYPKHVDERGMFQELFRATDKFPAKQVSICTIEPGKTRGGHYHKEMIEAFVVIEGEMMLTIMDPGEDLVDEEPSIIEKLKMTIEQNQMIINYPYKWHEVYSEGGCKFIILLDREFDPEKPDTYTL